MYPVVNQNQNSSETGFWDHLYDIPNRIESKLPTMDKSLDAYFDTTFASVIEEWELLTDTDLNRLESRLANVSNEISTLYAAKTSLETRAKNLDTIITSLEKSV